MKNKLFIIMVSSFMLIACASVEKNDSDLQKQVYDKVSEEFTTCSSYYSIVSAYLKRSGKQKSADQADDAMEKTFGVALDLAMQNNTDGKASRITWSRFQSSLEEMERSAGNNFSNITQLHSQHGERCKWIMASPEELMKEITLVVKNKMDLPK